MKRPISLPILLIVLFTGIYLLASSAWADAEQPAKADTVAGTIVTDTIKKVSPYSVSETMDRLETLVKKKGFTVFARINHQKNAQAVNLEMNEAQLLIFGNPRGGTLLMQQDIGVALDLPLRIAVYQATDNKAYIAYHNPVTLFEPYQLQGNKVIPKASSGLDKLTTAVISRNQGQDQ